MSAGGGPACWPLPSWGTATRSIKTQSLLSLEQARRRRLDSVNHKRKSTRRGWGAGWSKPTLRGMVQAHPPCERTGIARAGGTRAGRGGTCDDWMDIISIYRCRRTSRRRRRLGRRASSGRATPRRATRPPQTRTSRVVVGEGSAAAGGAAAAGRGASGRAQGGGGGDRHGESGEKGHLHHRASRARALSLSARPLVASARAKDVT